MSMKTGMLGHIETEPRRGLQTGPAGVAFTLVDARRGPAPHELCTDEPDEALAAFAAAPAGRLAAVAWRYGPLSPWRWQAGERLPAPLRDPEFRRVQGCAYRCLAGYLARCGVPRLVLASGLRNYGGYFRDLHEGVRAMVEHEIAWSARFLVDCIDVERLTASLLDARALEAFSVPRYPGDEADALPPGIFVLRT